MKGIVQRMGEEAREEKRTLEWFEKQAVMVLKGVGQTLVAGLCELYVRDYPAAEIRCECGGVAVYQRQRAGQTKTLLGEIVVMRAYYLCATCQHGHYPLDALLELMALMGAEFVFAEAAEMLEKLTLVAVSPNACRKEAETLGKLIADDEERSLTAAWDAVTPTLPTHTEPITGDFYVSMDGVTVHIDGQGWKNQWLGAIYTTKATVSRKRPDELEVRTQLASFYTDLGDTQTFGQHLWLEAQRRGIDQARRVIVIAKGGRSAIADGAHWIWNHADEHYPDAIQILDWYHASAYVWQAAKTLYGDGSDLAQHWAKQYLDLLWEGHVLTVIDHLEREVARKPPLQDVLTYFRNHHHRMRYDLYRNLGLHIGSGAIESGCKHVIAARLKQAGMIWSGDGARFIAKLRTRLKSRRWDETLALRSHTPRAYLRNAA
jgi:hypothetical protein